MGPQRWFLGVIGLVAGLASTGVAHALSMSPLRLDESVAHIQAANPTDRPLKIALEVRLQVVEGSVVVPAAKPLSEDEFTRLIRVRPKRFTLAPGQKRTLTYKILAPDETPPLFLCSVADHTFYRLRVCSRWAGSASASPGPL